MDIVLFNILSLFLNTQISRLTHNYNKNLGIRDQQQSNTCYWFSKQQWHLQNVICLMAA